MPDLRQGCATGKTTEETMPADALVLFGAMGDLAHKKIFPALYQMVRHGHLDVPVIGIARTARTDEHLDSIHFLDQGHKVTVVLLMASGHVQITEMNPRNNFGLLGQLERSAF